MKGCNLSGRIFTLEKQVKQLNEKILELQEKFYLNEQQERIVSYARETFNKELNKMTQTGFFKNEKKAAFNFAIAFKIDNNPKPKDSFKELNCKCGKGHK